MGDTVWADAVCDEPVDAAPHPVADVDGLVAEAGEPLEAVEQWAAAVAITGIPATADIAGTNGRPINESRRPEGIVLVNDAPAIPAFDQREIDLQKAVCIRPRVRACDRLRSDKSPARNSRHAAGWRQRIAARTPHEDLSGRLRS